MAALLQRLIDWALYTLEDWRALSADYDRARAAHLTRDRQGR